ncbi:MAG: asparagine synthase (glutamine-hydrolyzing) [Chloroflexi bacterium]|nr:MAG: asparagine synthase (glutamine-hydrolyzing) [Chloroflexota bacterium]
MCGIAGVVSIDPAARSRPVVRQMLGAIAHRGPDDEGLLDIGIGSLGARRLAIIDLARGHQPMTDESGSISVVQNGEIYNFIELRAELLAHGHSFRTDNDTEVLPHAYQEWGTGFVERLRGMFALALWDSTKRTLLLARDRFGKKPLVYALLPGGIAFASEIQGLLQHPSISRQVDTRGIDDYLTFGYVPAPRTAFSAISKVPPAHVFTWNDGVTDLRRYWHLAFTPKLNISLEDAATELCTRIDDAVRVRLMSDVPLGAFLSGGLDSSTVVAFMARHSERPVKTFSIGFRDQAYDELEYARIVARAYGTEHREFIVDSPQTIMATQAMRSLPATIATRPPRSRGLRSNGFLGA